MKTNPGPAHCLADISKGMTRNEVRQRWKAGQYGAPGMRPRPTDVDGWLKLAGTVMQAGRKVTM